MGENAGVGERDEKYVGRGEMVWGKGFWGEMVVNRIDVKSF
jgi:hypothetical protein